MANLARINVLDNTLDEMLRGFFVRPMNLDTAAPVQLRIDVSETEGAYSVRAEIPGVKKEDIYVAIEGNQVEISAEVKNERDVKEGEKLFDAVVNVLERKQNRDRRQELSKRRARAEAQHRDQTAAQNDNGCRAPAAKGGDGTAGDGHGFSRIPDL